jgi:hypothetical protein
MEMVWFWSGNETKSAGFDGPAVDIAGNSSNGIGNSKVFGNNPHGESSPPVQSNLGYRPPNGKKLFLSISPLNKDRSDIAPYWGEKDNMPLPQPWDQRQLNNTEVKKAFLNFIINAFGQESRLSARLFPAKTSLLPDDI